MDDFREHIEKEQNIVERIVEFIPGYRSYRQRERRRDIDKALRTYIANNLRDVMTRLRNLSKPLTTAGKLDSLDDIDNLYRRMETIADKILLASYGYSGFFDVIKIREKELDALYDFDMKLLESVRMLQNALSPSEENTLVADTALLSSKLQEIESQVRQLETRMIDRTNLIAGIKGL